VAGGDLAGAAKKARAEGRSVVFADESGFMLQPLARRTWAPRGRTPVLRSWDRHDRWSVIAAVTVSPTGRRLGLCWEMQAANYDTASVKAFAEAVQRRLGRPILLVWDRLPAHRSAARQWRDGGTDRIAVEWLPGYAPDLNPTEQVWGHTKWADLADFVPGDAEDLGDAITESLAGLACESHLLRSFFQASGLTLDGPVFLSKGKGQ
jgi:hypothetical protein